ncbi:unnamed protein product [Brassicogethes aeneus]|uniref:Protein twisted gastrulation n=1 Tax=Brassicogethes aeneus TaxID=1431903 RepID=A0A9P0AWX1_BRAAE|nr:unnamed protein product [Brassicogethes aeneus]
MPSQAITLLLLTFLLYLLKSEACNEAVCGSIVSKCLLTKSCDCERNEECSCCKSCFNCLSDLYTECCACVDMCPQVNETDTSLSTKSHVEDFKESVEGLFQVLTEYSDDRWNSLTFPVDIDISMYAAKKEVKIYMKTKDQETFENSNIITLNCTVAYWEDCMSWKKCKTSCQSMGASSYRWFHDGCCECIGKHCINYGVNESKCKNCPFNEEEENIDEEDLLDYGEETYDDYGYEDEN